MKRGVESKGDYTKVTSVSMAVLYLCLRGAPFTGGALSSACTNLSLCSQTTSCVPRTVGRWGGISRDPADPYRGTSSVWSSDPYGTGRRTSKPCRVQQTVRPVGLVSSPTPESWSRSSTTLLPRRSCSSRYRTAGSRTGPALLTCPSETWNTS